MIVSRARSRFARICVEISATKAFPSEILIDIEGTECFSQAAKAEWMPAKCPTYKKNFHDSSSCPLLKEKNPKQSDSQGEWPRREGQKNASFRKNQMNPASSLVFAKEMGKKKTIAWVHAEQESDGWTLVQHKKKNSNGFGLGSKAGSENRFSALDLTGAEEQTILGGISALSAGSLDAVQKGLIVANRDGEEEPGVVSVACDDIVGTGGIISDEPSTGKPESVVPEGGFSIGVTVTKIGPDYLPRDKDGDGTRLAEVGSEVPASSEVIVEIVPQTQQFTEAGLAFPSNQFDFDTQLALSTLSGFPTRDPLGSNTKSKSPLTHYNESLDSNSQTLNVPSMPIFKPDSNPFQEDPGEESSDASDDSDVAFSPGFIPIREDLGTLRRLMKEGVNLVPPKHQSGFLDSVDHANDGKILNFFKKKFRESAPAKGNSNFLTFHGLRRSPRIRSRPTRLVGSTGNSWLKKGFIK